MHGVTVRETGRFVAVWMAVLIGMGWLVAPALVQEERGDPSPMVRGPFAVDETDATPTVERASPAGRFPRRALVVLPRESGF